MKNFYVIAMKNKGIRFLFPKLIIKFAKGKKKYFLYS